MPKKKNQKTIGAAFLSDVFIMFVKAAAALFTRSASLTAEAIHSFIDVGNQILLFVGEVKSKKPATDHNPLGFGRESFFWSFVVALLLFTVGGIFSIAEGVYRLSNPDFNHPGLSIAILAVSAVAEGYSLNIALGQIRKEYKFKNILNWFKNAKSPVLLVVFSEDTAALLGILVAIICIGLAWVTGNDIWDSIGSIGVGLVLVFAAISLAIEIKSLIIGEGPSRDYRPEIIKIVRERFPCPEIKKYLAVQSGDDEVSLFYGVMIEEISDVKELVHFFNELEQKVKEKFPEVKRQFITPIVNTK